MKTTLLYLILTCASLADVLVYNRSQDDCIIDNTTVVPALTDSSVVFDSTSVVVGYGFTYYNSQAVDVVDGSIIVVGDNGVSVTTPLSSWVEIFMKGFFVGALWEAMGLLFRAVRAIKSQRGEVL